MIWGPKKSVTLVLPQRLYERVKGCADKREETVSWYVRRALRFSLWHEENEPDSLLDRVKYWQ